MVTGDGILASSSLSRSITNAASGEGDSESALHTRQTIETLRERIRQIERSRRPRRNSQTVVQDGLDRFLVRAGLRRGVLVEWLSRGGGGGASTLALATAAHVCQHGTLVVVDGCGEFYPPAAAGLGIDLENLLIVRPRQMKDSVWALEQTLGCSGVAAVLSWVGRLDARTFRRLQLAADAGGVAGVLVRPASVAREPSFAALRLRVDPVRVAGVESSSPQTCFDTRARIPGVSKIRSQPPGPLFQGMAKRRVRVEVLRCRSGPARGTVELEIDDATGDVRLATELAAPATGRRSARA